MFTSLLSSGRTGRRGHRAALRLEALDARLVPATFSYDPATDEARVEGDNAADTIVILDHGDGSYTVTDENGTTHDFDNVESLYVNTAGGDDVVRYKLDGTLVHDSDVFVDLMDGHDRFTGTVNRDITAYYRLLAWVHGGSGNDLLTLYGTPTAPARANDHLTDGLAINTNGLRIDPNGGLAVYLEGGLDNDQIFVDYRGQLDGYVSVYAHGGGGDDTVSAILRLQDGSTGRVGWSDSPAGVYGAYGSDTLTFHVFEESGSDAEVYARIDGGVDWYWPFETDRGSRTANVQASWLEVDDILD